MSNARALYPKHQIRRRARGNGSALELLVAALVVVTSTAIYSLSRSDWSSRRLRSKVAAHDLSLCVDRHQVAAERLQPGVRSAATRSGPPTFFGLGMFLFTDCHPPLSAPCPPSPRLEDSVCNFSSQRRPRCIKDKMHGKLEEGTAPNFDRAPDD